jgi:hypothetical protein
MTSEYNLGIVGYRGYNDYNNFKVYVDKIIETYGIPKFIVSGGHTDKYGNNKPGTDTLAWLYSERNRIPIIEHEADWNKYGKAAGPIRNKLIVKDSDFLIAFVSPSSVGTLNTINLANNKGIRVHIVEI